MHILLNNISFLIPLNVKCRVERGINKKLFLSPLNQILIIRDLGITCRSDYSLTPPTVKPEIKNRWKKRYNTTSGTTLRRDPAIKIS